MYKLFTHSSVFHDFMAYASLLSRVRLVSAHLFGQLICVQYFFSLSADQIQMPVAKKIRCMPNIVWPMLFGAHFTSIEHAPGEPWQAGRRHHPPTSVYTRFSRDDVASQKGDRTQEH